MFLNLMVSALNFLRKRTFVISITTIGPKIYCYSVVLLCTCSEKQIFSSLKKTLLTLLKHICYESAWWSVSGVGPSQLVRCVRNSEAGTACECRWLLAFTVNNHISHQTEAKNRSNISNNRASWDGVVKVHICIFLILNVAAFEEPGQTAVTSASPLQHGHYPACFESD